MSTNTRGWYRLALTIIAAATLLGTALTALGCAALVWAHLACAAEVDINT